MKNWTIPDHHERQYRSGKGSPNIADTFLDETFPLFLQQPR
jgi:hypothetical protein